MIDKQALAALRDNLAGDAFHREFRISGADAEARTVALAFSSDEPIDRWYGKEILDHASGSVRLERLQNAAAVLVNHDANDQVGVVESATLDADGKGRAVVRFGKSTRANDIFQDVADGIRQLVSVGYRIHSIVLDGSDETGEVYRVTDWEPFEISIVSTPADATVGIGRSAKPGNNHNIKAVINMTDKTEEKTPAQDPAVMSEAERREITLSLRGEELDRIKSIEILGTQSGKSDAASRYISEGRTVKEFISHIGETAPVRDSGSPDIGLTDKEVDSFRMTRLILAQALPNDARAQNAAGFELRAVEAAGQAQREAGNTIAARGVVLPGEVGRADMSNMVRAAVRANLISPMHVRALTAGTATDGAELVATDLMAMNFIDVLRNRLVVMAAGAVMLDGLVGDVAIPRKTTGSAGGWIAEAANAAETDPQFDQVTMSPKTVAGFTDFSRNLLMQSSLAVEAMVRIDQAQGIATTIDLAALYGTGSSGQPTGVSQQTGINAPTAFAAAVPTFAEVVAMESAVAVDNADMGALGYILETAMRGSFKTTLKASGVAGYIWEPGGLLNGNAALVSNQVTSGDIFYGNWQDLIIGAWGGLDVLVDPYTGSRAGTIRVVSHQSVDVAVRHPVSFAFNNDTA